MLDLFLLDLDLIHHYIIHKSKHVIFMFVLQPISTQVKMCNFSWKAG